MSGGGHTVAEKVPDNHEWAIQQVKIEGEEGRESLSIRTPTTPTDFQKGVLHRGRSVHRDEKTTTIAEGPLPRHGPSSSAATFRACLCCPITETLRAVPEKARSYQKEVFEKIICGKKQEAGRGLRNLRVQHGAAHEQQKALVEVQ
eukprot:RCo022535